MAADPEAMIDQPGTDEDEVERDPLAFPEHVDPGDGTMLDRLREQREAIAAEVEVVLPVAVFDGQLAVHYKLLPWKDVNDFAKRVQQQQGRDQLADLQASASLVAQATIAVVVPDPEQSGSAPEDAPVTWGWKSIDPSGEPVRFDTRLLELFRIDVPGGKVKGRDVVRLVFNRDHAVTAHAQEVMLWMQGENGRVTRDYAEG